MDVPIDCPCSGTPHAEGDTVVLRERLDSVSGLAIKYAVASKVSELREAGQIEESGEVTDEAVSWLLVAFINQRYLIYGVSSWTLLDPDGKALRVTPEHLRKFMEDHPAEAMAVGEKADELYAEAVMLPLLKAASSSSQPGPTNASTSAKNGSSPKSRKPSSPSSTESTQTVGIGATSVSSATDSSSSAS